MSCGHHIVIILFGIGFTHAENSVSDEREFENTTLVSTSDQYVILQYLHTFLQGIVHPQTNIYNQDKSGRDALDELDFTAHNNNTDKVNNNKILAELHQNVSHTENQNLSYPILHQKKMISLDQYFLNYYQQWLKLINAFLTQPSLNNHYQAVDQNSSFKSSAFTSFEHLLSNHSIVDFDPNETNATAFYPLYYPYHEIKYEYPPWDNLTNDEQKRFLELELGKSQRYNATLTAFLSSYYGTLLLVGVPGNILTCLIILTNPYMRTAPNIFLFNLAVVDLVTLTMSKLFFNIFQSFKNIFKNKSNHFDETINIFPTF